MNNQILSRAISAVAERAGNEGNRQWFRLVTPAIDRHGTIIRPEGVKTERYAANPVFLWMHESSGGLTSAPPPDVVIGRTVEWDQSDAAFDILVEFDEGSPFALECLRKVRAKLIGMVSIGFKVLKEHTEDVNGRKAVPIYDEVELLEASLVIIGSNPEALALRRSMAALLGAGGDLSEGVEVPTVQASVVQALQVPDMQADYLARDVAGTGDQAALEAQGTVTMGQKPTEKKPMQKMTSRQRMYARYGITHAVSGADMHLEAIGGDEDMGDEQRSLHQGAALGYLDQAERMVKALKEAHPEPDGDERATPAVAHTMVEVKDSTVSARYAEVCALASPYLLTSEDKAVAEVVRSFLGTQDADEVEAKIAALQMRSARLDEMRAAERQHGQERENQERERVIGELLDAQIITPALAQRARGIDPATGKRDAALTPWSVAKLEKYRAEAGEPIAPITRVAPLRSLDPNGGTSAGNGAGNGEGGDLRQPQIQHRGASAPAEVVAYYRSLGFEGEELESMLGNYKTQQGLA